jgi:hypothetical protein
MSAAAPDDAPDVMTPDDPPAVEGQEDAPAVMGTVDATTFVIAAIDRDGAWLSMPDARAPTLADWR